MGSLEVVLGGDHRCYFRQLWSNPVFDMSYFCTFDKPKYRQSVVNSSALTKTAAARVVFEHLPASISARTG